MAPPPPPPAAASLKAVSAKRYTLWALLATLAVAVIVTSIFVLLSPARITFSVAHTGSSNRSSSGTAGGGGGGSLVLSLTLAADNPSRRAKVTYESMFVDVSNSTGPGGHWDNWVRATLTTSMPLDPPGRTAAIDATVPLVDAPWIQDFTGNMSRRFSVVVTAQARFRVGVARTRLYDIKVSCSPVSFFPEKVKPAGAAAAVAGGSAAGGLPVRCV